MENTPQSSVEELLFIWSLAHNKVLIYNDDFVVGRSHEPFKEDEFLEKDHLHFVKEESWSIIAHQTTNGTIHNTTTLADQQKVTLLPYDIIQAGDQVFVVLPLEASLFGERSELLENIKLAGEDFEDVIKMIQTRSISFFKFGFQAFQNFIKKMELEKKMALATAKMQQDLAPYDERIAQLVERIGQLKTKRAKIEGAWKNKIAHFEQAIDALAQTDLDSE